MQKVIMLCGVPGSGKSWVINQLAGRYAYVSHDQIKSRAALVKKCCDAACGSIPVIVDCPFAERLLRGELESAGLEIEPVFIVEKPSVVESRYIGREGKRPALSVLTRANTIIDRAEEWDAVYGKSADILSYLLELSNN